MAAKTSPGKTLIILGGGCAGLSLASRLAENPGDCESVTILERRDSYVNDRTWCYWRTEPHFFEPLVLRSWAKFSVRSLEDNALCACDATPYQMIESENFYRFCQEKISGEKRTNLVLGAEILEEPACLDKKWHIVTNKGEFVADSIIDTRPCAGLHAEEATLWQSFLGQSVVCSRAAFDPETVGLMGFGAADDDGIAFSYVLPFAPDRALVETTIFGAKPLGAAALADRQAETAARLCGGASCEVHRVESGILPMGLRARPEVAGAGYVRVGLTSGAVRPATGYAFQRIQRWAERCAAAIRRGDAPCGHPPDPSLTRFMDGLFLKVLRAHPEKAPALFVHLFRDAGTAHIVRFLSDRATLADRAAIIAALPVGLFLKEAFTDDYTLRRKWAKYT